MNSKDIFDKIGLILHPENEYIMSQQESNYIASLDIEVGDNENYVLNIKQNSSNKRDSDNPHKLAKEFCKTHRLNQLAVGVVQKKIIEAKQLQENRKNKKSKGKAISTKPSTLPKSITPQKKQKDHKQTQDNFYLRSILQQKYKEEERRKRKAENDQKEEQKLTFKPQINNVSKKIVQFLRTQNIKKKKKPQPKRNNFQEIRECTFQPKINKVSEMIINNRTLRHEEHDNYNSAFGKGQHISRSKSSKALKNNESKETFKPKISEKSRQIKTIPFYKRLEMDMAKNKQENRPINDETCTFQPKIGRPPKIAQRNEKDPVWKRLHETNPRKQGKQEYFAQQEEKFREKNQTGSHYYENLVLSRIRNVFQQLDSDGDGIISPDEIGIENLSTNSLIFLKPIFLEMDELEAELDETQFVKAVRILLSDSNPAAKGAFLSQKWWKQEQKDEYFKPKINEKSKFLASHRSGRDLYQEGLKGKKDRQERLEIERMRREEEQLAECSFKPVLNPSKYCVERLLEKRDFSPTFMLEDD